MKITFSPTESITTPVETIEESSTENSEYPVPNNSDHEDLDSLIRALKLLLSNNKQSEPLEPPKRFQTINEFLRDGFK